MRIRGGNFPATNGLGYPIGGGIETTPNHLGAISSSPTDSDLLSSKYKLRGSMAIDATVLPQSVFSRRSGHCLAYFKGRFILYGGGNPALNDLWTSTDGATWTWVSNAALAGGARSGACMIEFNNKLWVFGGSLNGGTASNHIHYSDDGLTWTQHTSNAAWGARSSTSMCVYNGKLWMTAGYTTALTKDVWYSSDGLVWTQATAAPAFSARRDHQMLTYNSQMWVLCGSSGNDTYYSTDGVTWTYAGPAQVTRRGYGAMVWNNKMWVFGGSNPTNSSVGYPDAYYSTDGITWTNASATGFPQRTWFGFCTDGTAFYAVGGQDTVNGGDYNTTFKATDMVTWRLMQPTWAMRFGHATATLNGVTYISGGYDTYTGGYYSDVWSTTDGINWTLVTDTAAFGKRYNHGMVAFNNKLWVIGGMVYVTSATSYRDVWYSTDGVVWTQAVAAISAIPAGGISSHGCIVFNNKIFILHGLVNGNSLSSVFSSTDGTTWTTVTLQGTAPTLRNGAAYAVHNGRLYCLGGYESTAGKLSTTYSTADGTTWAADVQLASGIAYAKSFACAASFGGYLWLVAGDTSNSADTNLWYFDGTKWVMSATIMTNRHQAIAAAAAIVKGRLLVMGGYFPSSGYTPWGPFQANIATNEVWSVNLAHLFLSENY